MKKNTSKKKKCNAENIDISGIIKDGFFISEISNRRESIAYYSLISSLKAFFLTAEDLEKHYYGYENVYKQNEKDIDISYVVDACNSITQFQHFIELFFKDILLEVNRLFVYDFSRKPELIIKQINNTITDQDIESVYFIECKDAIRRLKTLFKSVELTESQQDIVKKYKFVESYIESFEKINSLRNRIQHRGAFIISPRALDELFGRVIIPFVLELEKCSGYSTIDTYGFHLDEKTLNPFEGIKKEYCSGKKTIDENLIHFYKLIGASAYRNPIDRRLDEYFSDFNNSKRAVAEEHAKVEVERNMTDSEICPVCGCKSLVYSLDSDEEYDEPEIVVTRDVYVSSVHCHQCGFHLNDWLLRKIPGWNLPIKDYSAWI